MGMEEGKGRGRGGRGGAEVPTCDGHQRKQLVERQDTFLEIRKSTKTEMDK